MSGIAEYLSLRNKPNSKIEKTWSISFVCFWRLAARQQSLRSVRSITLRVALLACRTVTAAYSERYPLEEDMHVCFLAAVLLDQSSFGRPAFVFALTAAI